METNQIVTKKDLELCEKRLMDKLSQLVTNTTRGLSEPSSKFLRTREVLKLLTINPKTLKKYRRNKLIPYKQVGNTFFYPEKELLELLNSYKSKKT